MADFSELALSVHQVFQELSAHELTLATGLQGLAPATTRGPSSSAQYLYDNAIMLKELTARLDELVFKSKADANLNKVQSK